MNSEFPYVACSWGINTSRPSLDKIEFPVFVEINLGDIWVS